MKIIKTFKNNELLTFTEDNKIKIYIDDNYYKVNIKKGYKMNLINSSKGSYKGSFMNNYICKKFIFNQKVNLVNIETNQILNCCKYFLLSENEYINLNFYNRYKYLWLLRSPSYNYTHLCRNVNTYGSTSDGGSARSYGFVPFFMKRKGKKCKLLKLLKLLKIKNY